MNLKFLSKNNLGVAAALLLVVLLSQSKVLNFLLDTTLGRALLILFILFISYTNKILGVVSVLFIIIMFNNSNLNYFMEGFTAQPPTTNDTTIPSTPAKKTDEEEQPVKPTNKVAATASPVTNDTTVDHTTMPAAPALATTSSQNVAKEGFQTLDIERSIQKGKQSNSIPVIPFMKESDSIAPYEASSFAESFSTI